MKQVDCLESMNFLKNESSEQLDSQENIVDKTSIVSPSINGAPFIIDLNDQDMKSAAVSLEEINACRVGSCRGVNQVCHFRGRARHTICVVSDFARFAS